MYEKIRHLDIADFRSMLGRVLPFLGDRVNEVKSWEEIGFLEVQVNRLKRWHRPGLLCIGDAAHASSPVAGFGANLAMQDAVAAANVLAGPLREGRIAWRRLGRVKRRRQLPTALTQAIQAIAQRDIVEIPNPLTSELLDALPTKLDLDHVLDLPLPVASKVFRRLARHVMTAGLRSEQVRVPAAATT
jgi:2-polyprenyl-6-methoxyphenol hydroxylase-like FAD-dependent oxidoreductase